MSDRTRIIEMATGSKRADRVEVFMDGDSGTWRLFVLPSGHIGDDVDFTLNGLRAFSAALVDAIADIEREPDAFNAEVRAQWLDR